MIGRSISKQDSRTGKNNRPRIKTRAGYIAERRQRVRDLTRQPGTRKGAQGEQINYSKGRRDRMGNSARAKL